MKNHSRFEGVDIIGTLFQIMKHNTEHYQTDFNYDAHTLTCAALDRQGHRSFLWLSRNSGTGCYPDRETYS